MSNEKQINVTVNGDTLTILEGQANKPYELKGYEYNADSVESLIALVESKGSVKSTVISYNENYVRVILDDTVISHSKDRLSYQYKLSQQCREWFNILTQGVTMDQAEFIKFLQRREPGEIIGIDKLMATLKQFKFVTNITGDFSQTDSSNYTFMIKVGDAEGTIKLPQTFDVHIEILNESSFMQFVEIELEVKKPKSEDEKPKFLLSCPKYQRYYNDAVKAEIEKLKIALPNHLIVAGSI